MPTLNVSVPDPMKNFVEEQVSGGAYGSVSEYVRERVRADQKRKAKDQLEAVVMEALKSNPETVTPDWWARLRKEYAAKRSQAGRRVPVFHADSGDHRRDICGVGR
jgi:antitoxin ParD1/3/4